MESRGQFAIAQRSDVGSEEWAAEQEEDWQGTEKAEGESFREEDEELENSGLPSQRMHSKGLQGNQTRSEPVSR